MPGETPLTGVEFWEGRCLGCAHPAHPVRGCWEMVGGMPGDGPQYCGCAQELEEMDRALAERARQADPEDIRLFHGHHPNCPYTIEGDWSVCGCGARQAGPVGLHIGRLADWLAGPGRESRLNERDVSASEFAARVTAVLAGRANALGGFSLPAQPVEPHPYKDEWSFQRSMSKGNPVAGKPIDPDQPCFTCGVRYAVHAAQPVEPGPLDVPIEAAAHPEHYRLGWRHGYAARLGEDDHAG